MDESTVIAYVDGGDVKHAFMQSVVDTLLADHHRGSKSYVLGKGGVISMVSSPRIANARNTMVQEFLSSTTASWLLMVDTDMVFTPEDVSKLIQSAHPSKFPIVGGLCFAGGRSNSIFPTLYALRPTTEDNPDPVVVIEDYPDDAMCKVDATGAAFLLMHRDTLKRMGDKFAGPSPWFAEGTAYKGFSFGEDWAFCLRAKDMGIPVYVNTGVKIGHVKPMILTEAVFKQRRAQ